GAGEAPRRFRCIKQTTDEFSDNPEHERFELVENGLTAFATYRRCSDTLVLPHVEIANPTAQQRHRWVAHDGPPRILRTVIDSRSRRCAYARSRFRRHPDRANLLE